MSELASSQRPASVLHVDLDAFYVSMEQRRNPELRGKPVVVCGGMGPRGVVTTASYEARVFGVRSAIPVARARQLCPDAIYIPSDFAYYAPASTQFHAILRDFTPTVEPAGADEAYLDVYGSERLFGDPPAIAEAIRDRVRNEIAITASVGLSTNKLVSKVASDAAKPDGLCVVPAGEEAAFFAPRPVRELPMVGPRMAEALAPLGVQTIGDIAALPLPVLQTRFGNHGVELWERSRGIYHSPVLGGRAQARSISRETTFDVDVEDGDRLRGIIRSQAEHVASQLAKQSFAAKTVTLKLRFPPFETITRSSTPGLLLTLADDIFGPASRLFERAWAENGRRPVRLLGVGTAGLTEAGRQLRLGEDPREVRLAGAVAELRAKFGDAVLRRGSEIPSDSRPQGDERG